MKFNNFIEETYHMAANNKICTLNKTKRGMKNCSMPVNEEIKRCQYQRTIIDE